MPTFGTWEVAVLDHAYEHIDYLSLHAYYKKAGDDRVGYLASADSMDEFITGVVASCDHVAAKRRTRHQIKLSFDEWNVERRPYFPEQDHQGWERAPRIAEDEYTAEDAVVVGNLLISLLRHSDRVAVACQAQLVNVIAPIRAEAGIPAWRQSIFHPFALTARHARGDVLRVEVRSDTTVESPSRGDVRPVDAAATTEPETGAMTIFAVNRADTDEAVLELTLADAARFEVVEHVVIGGDGLDATNNAAAPDAVAPTASTAHDLAGRCLRIQLPKASWTMLRLERSL